MDALCKYSDAETKTETERAFPLDRDFGMTISVVTHDPKAAKVATVTRSLDKGILLPL